MKLIAVIMMDIIDVFTVLMTAPLWVIWLVVAASIREDGDWSRPAYIWWPTVGMVCVCFDPEGDPRIAVTDYEGMFN